MVAIIFRSGSSKQGRSGMQDAAHFHIDPQNKRWTVHSHAWRPPTDVYETEDTLVVRVEIGGMREEDFTVVLDGRYLLVRGMRSDISERRAYHQMEIYFGDFSTEMELPYEVAAEKVEAQYQNGLLRITLPKAHPQRIQIEED